MTNWEKKQKIFDKAFSVYEQGKATQSFWEYITRELGKLESSPEDWRAALIRTVKKHPRSIPTFHNQISDEEVARIASEVS